MKGFKILDINWKSGKLEVDIIARDKETLVIVEVKTRNTDAFEEPEDAVDMKKQKKLIRAANDYAFQRNISSEIRFDIVSIVLSGNEPEIEHIIDAFYPVL